MPGIVPSMHGVGACEFCGGDGNEYPCTCGDRRQEACKESHNDQTRVTSLAFKDGWDAALRYVRNVNKQKGK